MGELKRPQMPNEQKKLFDDKTQEIVDYLNRYYNIYIPVHDPSKIEISHKDENRYEFAPSFNDVFLDLDSAGISVSVTKLRMIIRSPNYIRPYDPIKDYFDHIRGTYQGTSHIDLLCKHITPRSWDDYGKDYYRQRTDNLIRKWLVACVACWVGSIPNPVALGFIHATEGMGKTYLTEFLLPPSLKKYYTISSKDDKKFDIEDVFTRYMIANFDELVGINKGSIDTFKSAMTATQIVTKMKHEEFPTKKPRISCATFTSNRTQELGGFLHESYGYRRFGSIELQEIDYNYSQLVDIDQLWAEALMLYESSKFDYVFNKEVDFPDFERYNSRYAIETDAMKYVQLYLSIPTGDEEGEILNASEIIKRLNTAGRIRKDDLMKVTPERVGKALKSLGFEAAQKRPQGSTVPLKGYRVIINE